MKIKNKLAYILIGILFFNMPSFSDEKNNGINFYTGMFDFSDDGKRSVLYGIEHQNENLYRDTIFGKNFSSYRRYDNKMQQPIFIQVLKLIILWKIKYNTKFYTRFI